MENQIQTQKQNSLLPSIEEWAHLKDVAKILCADAGDLLPKALNTPGKILAIALIAKDLNIPLMQALSSIYLVEGKSTMSGEQMRALIMERCAGAKIEFKRMDNKGCELIASRPGQKAASFSFIEEDAKAAGLLNKANWLKHPTDMFLARATARMARSMFPDIIRGASYVPDEVDTIDVTPQKGNEIVAAVAAAKIAVEATNDAVITPALDKVAEQIQNNPPAEAPKEEPKTVLKTTEIPVLRMAMSEEELIKMISEAGLKLGLSAKDLNREIEKELKKKPAEITKIEMVKFLSILENRIMAK